MLMQLKILALSFAVFSASLFAQQPAFQPRSWFLADGRDVEAALVSAEKEAGKGAQFSAARMRLRDVFFMAYFLVFKPLA